MNILIDNENPYWPVLYIQIEGNNYYVVRCGGASSGRGTIGWIRLEVEEVGENMYGRLNVPSSNQLHKYITHVFNTDELDIEGF